MDGTEKACLSLEQGVMGKDKGKTSCFPQTPIHQSVSYTAPHASLSSQPVNISHSSTRVLTICSLIFSHAYLFLHSHLHICSSAHSLIPLLTDAAIPPSKPAFRALILHTLL